MMPRAGGVYVFLRQAYGPAVGFLFGWTLFFVIQTGTIAAVAIAFAKFTGVFRLSGWARPLSSLSNCFRWLRHQSFDGAIGGHRADCPAHLEQHTRP